MSTTMTDINQALRALAAQVVNLDLTKEKEVSKIKDMEKAIVSGGEAITKMSDFNEERLSELAGIFQTAAGRAELYDSKEELKKEIDLRLDGKDAEAGKVAATRQAREDAAEKIKAAKEQYSKQEKVLQIYGKKYDQKILEDRLNARKAANERKIEQNQKKLDAIRDFEESDAVKKQTEVIQRTIDLEKALEPVKELILIIEKIEARIAAAPAAGVEQRVVDGYRERLRTTKEELKTKTESIATKYSITLDPTNIAALKTQVNTAESAENVKAQKARNEIVRVAYDSKDPYVKKELHPKLKATTEYKDIIKVFGKERHQIGTENLALTNKNTAVSQSVSTLELGRNVVAAGNATPTIAEPTETEIQEQINADDTLKNALANVLSKEDRNKQVYEWLLKEKGKENKGWHPILKWKAKHSQKAIEAWENQYNQATMEEATNRAKAKKQADAARTPEAQAVAKKQTLEADFRKQLLVHVMGVSTTDLDKMLKDGEKGKTEATLDTLYTQLEDQEYSK